MKKILMTLFFLHCMYVAAQDVIVKKDGTTILSTVLEVTTSEVKYKRQSNQNGPTYSVSISEVLSINYKNGERDTFGDSQKSSASTIAENQQMTNNRNSGTSRLINKPADKRNAEIIALYNRPHPATHSKRPHGKAKVGFHVFGVSSTSVMSNEDIEMTFVRHVESNPWGGKNAYYNIVLQNKTNNFIYIDMANTLRTTSTGSSYCYYNGEQVSVGKGNSSGTSVALGAITGAMGIGGRIGQIANGVSVGGTQSGGVSTTVNQQRVIAIPPHGQRNLTEEKWMKTQDGNMFNSGDFVRVEMAEWFNNQTYEDRRDGYCTVERKSQVSIMYNKGQIKKGETNYTEATSPYSVQYDICYSTSESFETYSMLHAKLFVCKTVSTSMGWGLNQYKPEKVIQNIDQNTVVDWFYIRKL